MIERQHYLYQWDRSWGRIRGAWAHIRTEIYEGVPRWRLSIWIMIRSEWWGGPSLAPSSLARKSYLLGKGWRNQWGVKYQCGIECGTFEYDRTHVLVVLTALRRGRRRRLCRRQLSDFHLIYNVQVARILMAIDLLGRHLQQYGMGWSTRSGCVALPPSPPTTKLILYVWQRVCLVSVGRARSIIVESQKSWNSTVLESDGSDAHSPPRRSIQSSEWRRLVLELIWLNYSLT